MYLCFSDCNASGQRGDCSGSSEKSKKFYHYGDPGRFKSWERNGSHPSDSLCSEGDGAVSCNPGIKEGHGDVEGREGGTSDSGSLFQLRLCPPLCRRSRRYRRFSGQDRSIQGFNRHFKRSGIRRLPTCCQYYPYGHAIQP